ncbi:MAG TPA: SH3 domain-containing protein, partial [Candidatus Nesterenkonia stercoripullorum]|nr:SH3 domain-containing protein [Candidatus Nesterenkonia stercoripullorum]
MSKKLSTAVVGTLAVGLTLPLSTTGAAASPIVPSTAPQAPGVGVDAPSSTLNTGAGVDITSNRNATTFRLPLAAGSYSYTSPYGPRCMPIAGASTYHLGQDLGARDGSPIYSIADGTVVRTFSGNRYNAGYIVVQHRIDGRTFHSAYLHMWNANTHVRTGQNVTAGQTIGLVGNSGPSTAPHLHLEVWDGAWLSGKSLNPTTWLAGRGVSLSGNAHTVLNISNPTSCTYYTSTATQLRASASSSGRILQQLNRGTQVTAIPGEMRSGMVKVRVNGRTGWVAHGHVTPTRPAGVTTPADNGSSSSGSSAKKITPTSYRVTAPLNVRSGPGTNYRVVQGMQTGEVVTVTATQGKWLQFTRNGQKVWSHGDYMRKVNSGSSSSGSSSSSSGQVNAGVNGAKYRVSNVWLRIRTGPGTNYSMLGTLSPNAQITATGKSGSWISFRHNNRTVWVHGDYLRKTANAPSSSGSSSNATRTATTTVWQNFRSGPSLSASVVRGVAPQRAVQIISGPKNGWYQVRLDGRTGWMYGAYLNFSSGGQVFDPEEMDLSDLEEASREGADQSTEKPAEKPAKQKPPQKSGENSGEKSGQKKSAAPERPAQQKDAEAEPTDEA